MRTAVILALFAAVPVAVAFLLAPEPTDRKLHVESFRYGKEPAVIRANRGDRLTLTFSARDTGHSFFLQEYGIDARSRPGSDEVEVVDPARPEAGLRRVREVTLDTAPRGPLGVLVSRSQFRCHVWCGPMHAFEHGSLVLWPNTLLCAGLGLLVGIVALGGVRALRGAEARRGGRGLDVLDRFPRLRALVRRRGFQFAFTGLGTLFLYVVVLTAIFGTQNAGRNLGVMLLWVVWLFFLVAVLTPLGGRIWRLACPLPLLGETIQRGTLTGVRLGPAGTGPDTRRRQNNRYRGLNLPWPRRLDNAWPRVFAMLALGTFSVALVALPRITGYVLLAMVLISAVLALVFEHRAFCRFLCPISSFLTVFSRSGRLALRVKDAQICSECDVKTCLKGSMKGWGCPFGLCAEEIRENDDCGLCTECVKTCAYDNVGVFWGRPSAGGALRSTGLAWLAVVMVALALDYCLVYLGTWPSVRDWVNILDKGNWSAFAGYAAALWAVALVVLPAVVHGLGRLGTILSGEKIDGGSVFRGSAASLVPLGLAIWIAFVIPMVLVNATFVAQSLSDPFGWGWNLLGARYTPWRQVLPEWIPWLQVGCVLTGVASSLRSNLANWTDRALDARKGARGAMPLALFLVGLAAVLVVFFAG